MKTQICTALFLAGLVLISVVSAEEKKTAKSVQDSAAEATEKKQSKRGLLDLGYGHGDFGSFGHDGGIELGHDFGGGFEDHGHVKAITITKTVKVPVPHLVPYPVEKKIPVPYPVKVPVIVPKPYPVHVPKPYPVHVDKPIPYPVIQKVPYPVKVPIKVPVVHHVPVPVPKLVPYTVHKPVPYPVKVPVIVEKKVPIYIKGHEGLGHDDAGFGGHDGFDFHH